MWARGRGAGTTVLFGLSGTSAALKDMFFKLFKSAKRVDFDHIGLIYRMGFSLWLDIKCSVSRNRFSSLLSLANL